MKMEDLSGSGRKEPLPPAEHRDAVRPILGELEKEAQRRVDLRLSVEQRWLEDLRQYHGVYDDDIMKKLNEMESSKIFLNLTAPKTNSLTARMIDLLFPTDDKNWSTQPTPVPTMSDRMRRLEQKRTAASARADEMLKVSRVAAEAGNQAAAEQAIMAGKAAEDEESEAQVALDELHARMREAAEKSRLMEMEIEDQLIQCHATAKFREMIHSGNVIGTGVIKGPIKASSARRVWRPYRPPDRSEEEERIWVLEYEDANDGAIEIVDPWGFFPDPDFARVEDGNGVFQRHLWTREMLRKASRERKDFDKTVLRELLGGDAKSEPLPSYMTALRAINPDKTVDSVNLYHVWEYTGPLENEHVNLLDEMMRPEGMPPLPQDILKSYHVKLWFCQGMVLSFALHPLDSGDCIYSVFSPHPDEVGPYGYGVPWMIRNPQSMLNAAVRMMMDNSGLSTGPQVVVNRDVVTPANGEWKLEPRKLWYRNNAKSVSGVPGFESFNIGSNQGELANIIGLAMNLFDEVSGIPALAQGEQGTGVTKTAQGMALLMNSANVLFRRMVRIFDDNVTVPLISRFYQWNMQFHPSEEIKGDMVIDARGASVLLVREMQANNLMMIAQIFGDHPVYGAMIKHTELMHAIFRAHMIPSSEIVKTREEIQREAQNGPAPSPEAQAQMALAEAKREEVEVKRSEIDANVSIAMRDADVREKIATMQYEATMERIAATLNVSREEIEQKQREAAEKMRSGERKLAAEIAMQQSTGVSSGGSV